MTQQTTESKAAALDDLYVRITRTAEAMNGTAIRRVVSVGYPEANVPSPTAEESPSLRVEMPGGFQADFAPSYPLSSPADVQVYVRRTLDGKGPE